MGRNWSLNPKEVYSYGGSSSISGRKNVKQSRKMDLRSAEINLVHEPTKIEVHGNIPHGHYTKKEMTLLNDSLYNKLFSELEIKVAKHLKISGI